MSYARTLFFFFFCSFVFWFFCCFSSFFFFFLFFFSFFFFFRFFSFFLFFFFFFAFFSTFFPIPFPFLFEYDDLTRHGNHNLHNARAGVLLIHRPAWVTHRWVPIDTHSTPVPERDGCGWLITTSQSTAIQCRNTANMVAERWQQERCVMADPETSVLLGCLFEQ